MPGRPPIVVRFPTLPEVRRQFEGLPDAVNAAVISTVARTADKAFERMRDRTPVDRGVAGGAISRWRRRILRDGLEQEFVNDAAHIGRLEFGGYPGTRNRCQAGVDPYTRTYVSKQAPRGMVRVTLDEIEPEFAFDLEEAVDIALSQAGF
jgi:hypothetical protein